MSMAVGSKIMGIEWCADEYTYLDWHIWNFCGGLHKVAVQNLSPLCVGIKHGTGLCGGGGHYEGWKNYNREDKDWKFFESIVADTTFYKKIHDTKV